MTPTWQEIMQDALGAYFETQVDVCARIDASDVLRIALTRIIGTAYHYGII